MATLFAQDWHHQPHKTQLEVVVIIIIIIIPDRITYTTCITQKVYNLHQGGSLHPQPVLHRPWSHIAMGFITGVPVLEGNTVILTIIDFFSKDGHFITLTKLPSIKEMVLAILLEVGQ